MDEASEGGLSAVAEEGEAWKSVKSSSSKLKLVVGTAEAARAWPAGGGGPGKENGDGLGAAVLDLPAMDVAGTRVWGDFAIGGGTGGDSLVSTGDWKSEKSSSKKSVVNGTADGGAVGRLC